MATSERMQWERLISAERVGRPTSSGDPRSAFQRDIDRILFCDPFRRLARKTQVHPLNENDHIHSRLTHSLETASVGRSLGEAAGCFLDGRGELPEGFGPHHLGEIVQAACLAHDIGNPPFGHSGETAIKNWFEANPEALAGVRHEWRTDFTRFDGNAMSVRILLSTGFYGEGMSPTRSVLGALLKYPWPSGAARKDKFSYFEAEREAVEATAAALGLPGRGRGFARHPLAYLTEAADDICYRIIDIEDATELHLLDADFMLARFGEVLGITAADAERYARYKDQHFRQRNSILRAKLVHGAILGCSEAFRANHEAIMTGTMVREDGAPRSLLEAADSDICRAIVDVYKGIGEQLFLSRRKAILELGAQNAVRALLDRIIAEVGRFCTDSPSQTRGHVRVLLGKELVDKALRDETRCPYNVLLTALDYVAGMTDQYATNLCRELLGLGF
ncbi:MAG: dNTP triphosphohydrolase [Desulfovibrionaceae bacterium]|jgi:dGTPase|nr:dNTP triphosphohydrolase [Desulfovibrionaceae bacterium]